MNRRESIAAMFACAAAPSVRFCSPAPMAVDRALITGRGLGKTKLMYSLIGWRVVEEDDG